MPFPKHHSVRFMTQSIFKAHIYYIVCAQGYWNYFQIFTSECYYYSTLPSASSLKVHCPPGSLQGRQSGPNSVPRAPTVQVGSSVPWDRWLGSNLCQLLFFLSSASSCMSSTPASLPWSSRSRRFSPWMRSFRATSSKSKVNKGRPDGWVPSERLEPECKPVKHCSASLLAAFFLHRYQKQWTTWALESALIFFKKA